MGVAGNSRPQFFLWTRIARAAGACYDARVADRTQQSLKTDGVAPDAELDLRGVICPYNFVKTKLKLETMQGGQVLAVMLDGGDPIRNVPRSVSDDGHAVLRQDPVENCYRVLIRKRADR